MTVGSQALLMSEERDAGLLDGATPRPDIRRTLRELFSLAWPSMFSQLLTLLNEFTNTLVIGQTCDDASLAGLGLGNTMQNCFGLSIGFGFCMAMDTLVSQANGAGDAKATGQALQRCRLIAALQLVWMVPLLWLSGSWLALIHQDLEVARWAGEYNRASSWGLFAVFQFEAGCVFLRNRQKTRFALVVSVVTSVLHVVWCVLFVVYCGLGTAGAGYASVVTWWTEFLLLHLYLAWEAEELGCSRRSLLWLEAAAWQGWQEYATVALPAMVQLCSEWWFWEICTLVVGYLGQIPMAAHVATLNYTSLMFMPVIGWQGSVATLVGNALGASRPEEARATVMAGVGGNLVLWSGLALFTLLARSLIASVYTPDPRIQDIIQRLLCIYAMLGFFDSSQNVMGGALRGMGLTSLAVWAYTIAYWVIMLPLGCVLAFEFDMGVYGFWYSMFVGTMLCAITFAIKLARLDYKATAAAALARLEAQAR